MHASAFYVEVKEKVIEEFPFKDETLKTQKRETISKLESGNYYLCHNFTFRKMKISYILNY